MVQPTLHPQFSSCLDDGRVRCELCPQYCTLRDGKRGVCYVRSAHQGKIVLADYGKSSGFCIDPVEKKPLNHFYPASSVLSFGTIGCNLGCQFCQNWQISKSRSPHTLGEQASPQQIAQRAKHRGCSAVAFTYNEPITALEYVIDCAHACHELGLQTIAISAGYINPNPRRYFFSAMDAANVDLKGFSERFYHKLCKGQLAPVLDTLQYIYHETSVWLEITTLLIPGENDSDHEIEQLSLWIAQQLSPDVPLHFSAYHPDFHLSIARTPASTLHRARQIALGVGLHYVYTGNIHDPQGSSTYCPQCQALLIERDGYRVGHWRLDHNRCMHCRHPIAGRFATELGPWHGERQPLHIA